MVMPKNTNQTKKYKSDKNIKLFQKSLKGIFFNFLSNSWAQTTKLKPNQTLFDRTHLNWHHFYLKKNILKYFNAVQNRHFSVLWLRQTQNQTFFHGAYSNLTSFFIGHKILKYFNDFYSWHLSLTLQSQA